MAFPLDESPWRNWILMSARRAKSVKIRSWVGGNEGETTSQKWSSIVWLLVCSNREEGGGGRERIKIDRSTGLFEDDYTVVFKKKRKKQKCRWIGRKKRKDEMEDGGYGSKYVCMASR